MDQVPTCLSSSPLATVAVHHFQRIARRKLHIIRTKKIHNLVEIKKERENLELLCILTMDMQLM